MFTNEDLAWQGPGFHLQHEKAWQLYKETNYTLVIPICEKLRNEDLCLHEKLPVILMGNEVWKPLS